MEEGSVIVSEVAAYVKEVSRVLLRNNLRRLIDIFAEKVYPFRK